LTIVKKIIDDTVEFGIDSLLARDDDL